MRGRSFTEAHSRRSFLKLSTAIALGAALSPARLLAEYSALCIERACYTMGSIMTVQAYALDEALAHSAIDEAFRLIQRIDAAMSVYDPMSSVSELNREGFHRIVACGPDLVEILGASSQYSRATRGAFDVTIQPLMELYGFRDDKRIGRFPSDREIAERLSSVGMENIIIDPARSTIALAHPGTRIDLGGIAVGYALDRAAEILRARGITSALLNHSGDIVAIGAPPGASGWEIGITDPVLHPRIITTAFIRDEALSTSGNYRQFRTIQGRTIGHILDPASGRTATALLSSTVIAPTASAADALSTGTFVLGSAASDDALRTYQADMIHVSPDPNTPRAYDRAVRRVGYRRR